MNGLVLLDEDQQRSLYSREPPKQQHTSQRGEQQHSDFMGSTRQQQTEFTSDEGLPRTDFTSQAAGQYVATTTSRRGGSGGKSSIMTKSSVFTADMTTVIGGSGTYDGQDALTGVDSYAMLRDYNRRESSTGSAIDHSPALQYAGTSSGLKISIRFIIIGMIVGLVLGVVLSQLEVSPLVAKWVSLPGDLFLRALKCLVVPYVFCSVAVAIGDIVFVGKISVIGLQTAKIFCIFWLSTVTLGVSVALAFRPLFRLDRAEVATPLNSIAFTCANKLLFSTQPNGTVSCSGAPRNSTAMPLSSDSSFVVADVNNVFAKNTANVLTKLSLSEQLMAMIVRIVSNNIIGSLVHSDTLSIITFSMVLGSIAGRNFFTKTRRVNYLYLVLLQLRNTFFLLMEWTIWLSPLAAVSIIGGSFANNQEAFRVFHEVYPYLLAPLVAALLQALVVYPLIVFLLTRCNPYSYMRQMIRAYVFGFASSSSLATMPVTLSCVNKAGVCSQSVANFVISIGAVSNISGMGFYLPIAVVFMAESSGNGDQITLLRIVGLFVLSLLASSGTPPIPASAMVVISTAYTTIFGELPSTFAYVVALDFIIDRISTTCNVNDDLMALKIISETTDETVAQDHLGERF